MHHYNEEPLPAHKLQDCPLTNSPQAPSISQLMVQSDPGAPPLLTALPAPSLLIDFLLYGQPWHTYPIHFAHLSSFWFHSYTTSLHTDLQLNDTIIASSSSRILWNHQLTKQKVRSQPSVTHHYNTSWYIWQPVAYLPSTSTGNLPSICSSILQDDSSALDTDLLLQKLWHTLLPLPQ